MRSARWRSIADSTMARVAGCGIIAPQCSSSSAVARHRAYLTNLLTENEAVAGVSTPQRGCGTQGTKSVADQFNPLAKAPCIRVSHSEIVSTRQPIA